MLSSNDNKQLLPIKKESGVLNKRIRVRLQAEAEELGRFQVLLLYIQSTSFTCCAKPWANDSHKQGGTHYCYVIKVEKVTKGLVPERRAR